MVVVGASRCRVPVGDLKIEAGVGSLAKASFRDILLIETQSTVYGILLMDQNGVLLKDLEASSLYLAIHYAMWYRGRLISLTTLRSSTQTYVVAHS